MDASTQQRHAATPTQGPTRTLNDADDLPIEALYDALSRLLRDLLQTMSRDLRDLRITTGGGGADEGANRKVRIVMEELLRVAGCAVHLSFEDPDSPSLATTSTSKVRRVAPGRIAIAFFESARAGPGSASDGAADDEEAPFSVELPLDASLPVHALSLAFTVLRAVVETVAEAPQFLHDVGHDACRLFLSTSTLATVRPNHARNRNSQSRDEKHGFHPSVSPVALHARQIPIAAVILANPAVFAAASVVHVSLLVLDSLHNALRRQPPWDVDASPPVPAPAPPSVVTDPDSGLTDLAHNLRQAIALLPVHAIDTWQRLRTLGPLLVSEVVRNAPGGSVAVAVSLKACALEALLRLFHPPAFAAEPLSSADASALRRFLLSFAAARDRDERDMQVDDGRDMQVDDGVRDMQIDDDGVEAEVDLPEWISRQAVEALLQGMDRSKDVPRRCWPARRVAVAGRKRKRSSPSSSLSEAEGGHPRSSARRTDTDQLGLGDRELPSTTAHAHAHLEEVGVATILDDLSTRTRAKVSFDPDSASHAPERVFLALRALSNDSPTENAGALQLAAYLSCALAGTLRRSPRSAANSPGTTSTYSCVVCDTPDAGVVPVCATPTDAAAASSSSSSSAILSALAALAASSSSFPSARTATTTATSAGIPLAILDALRRHIAHAPAHAAALPFEQDPTVIATGGQSFPPAPRHAHRDRVAVARLLTASLDDPRRGVRIAAGRVLALVVEAHCKIGDLEESSTIDARLAPLWKRFSFLLHQSRPSHKETALIALGRLGRYSNEAVLSKVLPTLVTQLGSSGGLLKALAYTELDGLARLHRVSPYRLLLPFFKDLSVFLVSQLTASPDLFAEAMQLMSQSRQSFLNYTVEHTVPHLVILGRRDLLHAVASAANLDVDQLLVSQIQHVLKHILLLGPADCERGLQTLCEMIGNEHARFEPAQLFRSFMTSLPSLLAIELGDNDPTRQRQAERGISLVESTIDPKDAASRRTPLSKEMQVGAFLRRHTLPFLAFINDVLSDQNGRQTLSTKRKAIRSIGAVIQRVGPTVSVASPQIMATLQGALAVDALRDVTLAAWHVFVTTLLFKDIGPFVGQMSAAFVTIWPRLTAKERALAASTLKYIVLDNAMELEEYMNEVAVPEGFDEELSEVAKRLRSSRQAWPVHKKIDNLIQRAGAENVTVCLRSLQELKAVLVEEREYVQSATEGDQFDSQIGRLVRVLLTTASSDGEQYKQVRDLSFQCLGILGALDPDRFDMPNDDTSFAVLNNFNDHDEAIEFALFMIQHHLAGAYRSMEDILRQQQLAYAIQNLLKFCGFTSALLPTSSGSKPASVKARQRWYLLPKAVVETVSPLLDSKYRMNLLVKKAVAFPHYLHTPSYREWLHNWTHDLLLKVKGNDAATVFGVFRAVVRGEEISIARQILPHLVLHVLISGSDNDRDRIREEFVAILTDQVDPKGHAAPERRLITAQTAFDLMDHLNKWVRRKNQEMQRQLSRQQGRRAQRSLPMAPEQSLLNVESVMTSIPQELMAQAALQCQAFARSLLSYEQRIRTLKSSKDDSDLQTYYENLHQIYAHLDEPDGMEGVSTKVIAPSLEHQIREHESTGRWTAAQSCWEVELQQRPDDLNLHVGLLRCLRNLGHYDTMRTHIRGVLGRHPEWEVDLGSFQLEGSWMVSDWEDVQAVLARPDLAGPEAAIARALLAMKSANAETFTHALVDARQELGKPISVAGTESYQRIYDSVIHLHVLHEIEVIHNTLHANQGPRLASLPDLHRYLTHRLHSTLPSFKTREPILSLRRTVFGARSPDKTSEVGESWLLSAKFARKAGHFQTAYSATLQAAQCQAPFAFVQRAKLLKATDQPQGALRELDHNLALLKTRRLRSAAIPGEMARGEDTMDQDEDENGEKTIDETTFAKALLLRMRWLVEAERTESNIIIQGFNEATAQTRKDEGESAHYHLGRYYDSMYEAASQSPDFKKINSANLNYYTCRYYLRALERGTKYFFRTLPRLLTVWLEMGDIEAFAELDKNGTRSADGPRTEKDLLDAFEYYRKTTGVISRALTRLPSYYWLTVFPQIVSRVLHRNRKVWEIIKQIITKVLRDHPSQAIWTLASMAKSKASSRAQKYTEIVQGLKEKRIINLVNDADKLAEHLCTFCETEIAGENVFNGRKHFPGLYKLAPSDVILPLQHSLSVTLPTTRSQTAQHQPFPPDLPTFHDFCDDVEVMNSLARPKKIVIVGSDGKHYPFLCKPKDDLRKDARLMEFNSMINKLLKANSESRKRRLYIRTYSVVILNEECGMIEWVSNTVGFRATLLKAYQARGIVMFAPDVRTLLDEARLNPKKGTSIFTEMILPRYPPVFHEWFLATFPEPTAWLKARLAYGRTAAIMSVVGFILGLGDRHGENILFDSMTGDTVHVDFNCLFDKGKTFEVPERVPFRLTQNLVDALGVTGVEGVFRRACEITMQVLRTNRDSLMSVLETLVHDPLVDFSPERLSRSVRKKYEILKEDPRAVEARKTLEPVSRKLRGLQITSGGGGVDKEVSVGNQVDSLIREATSPNNLCAMYIGWCPYI